MSKIVLVAGGTGGHVFPALCVAKKLNELGYKVEIITDSRGSKYCDNISYIDVTIHKINNKNRLLLYLYILLNLLKNLFKFLINRPNCVIGFGGYPSIAPVLAAQILGIKNCVHEQNAVVGQANKYLSKFASKVLTSFDIVKGLNGICVGNPTRFEHLYSNKLPEKSNDIFTILIFGGSQGATIFTDVIAQAICNLASQYKLRIYHQARVSDIEKLISMYEQKNIEFQVLPFFNNMDELYEKANLVISRSGASSIFEIIGFKNISILIPYSKSKNGDQLANAEFLSKNNAAILINESELSIEKIQNTINSVISGNFNYISNNISKLKMENCTEKFISQIICLK